MRTLEVKFLGKFESKFENALVYESGDQLGTLCEISLDKKISRYCPFKRCLAANHISFFFIVTFTIKLFACVALPLHTIPVLNVLKPIENCE
jgi:hypothetical protein